MNATTIELVSHHLCPYVQRVAIALAERRLPFTRTTISLEDKPDWFLAISPAGKVPLLRTERGVLFESAAILEYVEECSLDKLHPRDAFLRARHRAWIEFGSGVLADIAGLYLAPDEAGFDAKRAALRARFERIEEELEENGEGPWFAGKDFSLVDAVFGPVFRYWNSFDRIAALGTFDRLPRVNAWRRMLASRPSVREAVGADYGERLMRFLAARNSHLGRMAAALLAA